MEVITQDFYLSAFLRLKGLHMVDMRSSNDNRKLFVFEDTEEFQDLKQQYYWKQAHVDPLGYKQAIRELKGLTMDINKESLTKLNTCQNTKSNLRKNHLALNSQ
ncbi:DUF5659 domain-containing protein [candidate division KSB1 bacterium]